MPENHGGPSSPDAASPFGAEPYDGNTVTIMKCPQGASAAKRWVLGEADPTCIEYGLGARFGFSLRRIAGILDLFALIRQLEKRPERFVISGHPNEAALRAREAARAGHGAELVRRARLPKGDLPAHFLEVPQRWAIADIDKLLPPDGLDPVSQSEEIIKVVREQCFPPELRRATVVWQWSAKAGFRPTVRAKIAFCLDRPVGFEEKRDWACGFCDTCPLDTATFRPVQPIFLSAPRFEGVIDPFPNGRTFLLPGESEVVVLPPRKTTARRTRKIAKRHKIDPKMFGEWPQGWRARLELMGDAVGLRGFHDPLLHASASFAATNGPEADKLFIDTARELMAKAPKGEGREPDLARYSSDAFLQGLLASARAKFGREQDDGQADEQSPPPVDDLSDALEPANARARTAQLVHDTFAAVESYLGREATRDADQRCSPDELFDLRAPQFGILADLGLGKTACAIQEIAAFLSADPRRRVAYVVPAHELAGEIARRLDAALGQSVARIWRGLEQPDPEDGSVRMCRRFAEDGLQDYLNLGGNLIRLCGGKRRGYCRYHPDNPERSGPPCSYERQRRERSRVWVVPAALLSRAVPAALRREDCAEPNLGEAEEADGECLEVNARPVFDVMVIDEAPWLQFVGGVSKAYNVPLRLLSLSEFDRIPDRHEGENAGARLGRTRREVLQRLQEAANGPLPDETAAQLASPPLAEASRLVWRAQQPLDAEPSASKAEIKRAVGGVQRINGAVLRVRRLLSVLAGRCADPAGGSTKAIVKADVPVIGAKGRTEPGVQLLWREEIHPTWLASPIIAIDGTGDPDVMRWWLPHLEVAGRARAKLPHTRVVQLTDASLRYTVFTSASDSAQANRARVLSFIKTLEALVRGRAPGAHDVLAVVPLSVRKEFEGTKGGARLVGPRTGLLHFGVERGVDAFGRVAALAVASRPLPSVAELEALAETCSGRRLACAVPAGEGYASRKVRRLARGEARSIGRLDRLGAAVDRQPASRLIARQRYHPDPVAERVRRQICEAALLQAIGRARAVNRTPRDPVLIAVLTDVPLPLEVDALLDRGDLEGDLWTLVADRLPVIPADQRALAALAPDLFPAGERSVESACERDAAFAEALRTIRGGQHMWLPWGGLAMPAVVRGRRRGRAATVPVALTFRPGGGEAEAVTEIARAVDIEGAHLAEEEPEIPQGAREGLLGSIGPDTIELFSSAREQLALGDDGVVRDATGQAVDPRHAAAIVLTAAEEEAYIAYLLSPG